ncbi:MAG: hypothetical protein JW934_07835 [Anaerolineae bacterium]|nr:hypothetical protein [Anaerolineae bacterium]
MKELTPSIKEYRRLVSSVSMAIIALAALSLIFSLQSAHAQGGIFVDKRLGRADPLVYVGEYITFTVFIRNDTTFIVTTLPLSDTFNAAVLRYADALPPPDSVDQPGGSLGWSDLTSYFGDLAPGANITVVVGFVAEHPQPAVVNAAEVHDALGSAGELIGGNGSSITNTTVGGSSPVDKLLAPGLIPQAGMPITYTILITNNGFVTITVAPLVDDYNPAWMAFSHAVPPPDLVDQVNGVLTWTDVTSSTGDIPSHGAVSVTTVFTALVSGENITNSTQVAGAVDWYGNDLDGGADLVPITIIDRPTATPQPTSTPQPTATPLPTSTSAPGPTPVPTHTPAPTLVAAVPTSAVPTPATLPVTGQDRWTPGFLLLVALLASGAGLVLSVHARRAVRNTKD